MKRVLPLVLVVALAMSAGMAFGQAGVIALYTDLSYTSCMVTAEPPVGQFLFVYVVHDGCDIQAKSSRWKLQNNGTLLAWVLDRPNGDAFGTSSQDGWAVPYGGCQDAPFLVATVWYQRVGRRLTRRLHAQMPSRVSSRRQISIPTAAHGGYAAAKTAWALCTGSLRMRSTLRVGLTPVFVAPSAPPSVLHSWLTAA